MNNGVETLQEYERGIDEGGIYTGRYSTKMEVVRDRALRLMVCHIRQGGRSREEGV
jgi:hypothetical protein